MEKLKQKLSSRKLWAAIIAVIVVLAVILLGEDLTPETVAALECVVGAAVAYIFGEGAVDVARLIAAAMGGGEAPVIAGEEKGRNRLAE